MYNSLNHEAVRAAPSADPEKGGQGVQTPSGKSQIKWVSTRGDQKVRGKVLLHRIALIDCNENL